MHRPSHPLTMSEPSVPGADLLERLRAGDPQAFRVVYETYRPRVYTFLFRLSRNEALAADLSQETWLRLATNARRLLPDTVLAAWLFTVARNLFRSHRRWSVLDRSRLAGLASLWEPPRVVTPGEDVSRASTQQRLEGALAALPLRYREVLLLVAVEGFDQRAVARILGISDATTRKRLSRARAALKLAVKEEVDDA